MAVSGPDDETAKAAWCYGDLGVAVAIFHTARSLDDPEWERRAIAIAERTIARARAQSHLMDTGICHGTAGLAHLYNRLAQASGRESFAAAAEYWVGETLSRRRSAAVPELGFPRLTINEHGERIWEEIPGIVEGSAGVALSLLSACGHVEPIWDALLLADIPSVSPSR